MIRFVYVLLCLCIASACRDNPFFKDAGPLVKTKLGSVVGKYVKVFDTDVAAFLGIPYAEPPVGEKRFLRVEPAKPWQGMLLADEKGPACMQYSSKVPDWYPKGEKQSENCLFLNVWSPTRHCCTATGNLPVLVWIHGGGFSTGSSGMNIYDGSVLASYGDVIVVTFNYRLGPFGFLSAGKGAPGNAGFHDQLLAFKWVQENVLYFGGDPKKVTIIGESAGSISATLHMVSPLSKNLFQRAILMSGTAYQPNLVDTAAVANFKLKTFSQILGCTNDTVVFEENLGDVIECMKSLDALKIAEAADVFLTKFPISFVPTFGDDAFPKHPIELILSGNTAQVDVLMGLVKDEATIFLNYMAPELFPLKDKPKVTLSIAKSMLPAMLLTLTPTDIEKVSQFYFENITEDDALEVSNALSYLFGDYVFNCPVFLHAEKLDHLYFYYNTHRSQRERKAEWLGSAHFYDVDYVFGKPIVDHEMFTPEDGRFSGDVIQKFASFARTGNPLMPDTKETWPLFSASEPVVHELNPRSKINFKFPRAEACELWRPYLRPPPSTTKSR